MSLIDYFTPIPVQTPLTNTYWGAPEVQPRDINNGLEDTPCKQWSYWDGQIIKGPDGRYHMFASRWDHTKGHFSWWTSVAVHAVSDNIYGPYIDQGLCWPDNEEGKGHNVTALTLPDNRYAILTADTRPGDVFLSDSLDGPWEYQGPIQIDANGYDDEATRHNISVIVRPDGKFMAVPRSGVIMISENGIMGPFVIQGPSVFKSMPELPQHDMEDPVLWYSGGQYHIVVNCWKDRQAYHITSKDGITNWTYQGIAYDPRVDFVKYSDGTVNRWHIMERPGVVMENGHVAYFTFAVIDVPKWDHNGITDHNSIIIVVPFNGSLLDKDLE